MHRPSLAARLLILFVLAADILPVLAQDEADKSPPAVADATDEAKFKEATIYVPYSKLRQTFETDGRGVFLPYEKFQELWKAARDNSPRPPESKPPVAALVTETSNEAVIAGDVVRVKALVRLEVLVKGWHKLPLRLEDSALTSATIDGQPARIVHEKDRGYFLLWQQAKDKPAQVELLLEYAKAFQKTPGRNTVEFAAPQAPVSRWQVRIDEPGVKIDIAPLIAASDVPAGAGRSQVQAFVGASDSVRIEWTPKSEGATGLAVLASVQTEQQVFVDENVTRTRAQLTYTISRAELAKIEIDLPADQRVVNVYDPNVRRWSVAKRAAPAAALQRVTVELFEPAKAVQKVVVEAERLVPEGAQAAISAPVIEAVGVGRQQGFVVVQVADALRAEVVKRVGLWQLDRAELPKALAAENWSFAYRFATTPFDLSLSVEKVQPQISVDSLVTVGLVPERVTLRLAALYTIERAGVFRLDFEIPTGYEVNDVRGLPLANISAAQVDSHRVEGDKQQRLVVNLSRKAQGRVGLSLRLTRALEEPNLLSPTGKSATLQIAIPRVAPATAERVTSRVIVEAPESLRVIVAKADGLRAASLQEVQAGAPLSTEQRSSGLPQVQGFLAAEGAAELTLQAERRKPHVTVRQLLVARVEPGAVKYGATFAYDILYSGLKSLRIDVPTAIAANLHNDTPGVRETVLDPAPQDLEKGYVAWSLAGDAEFFGSVPIKLSWERPLEKFETGKTVDVPLPWLKPHGADRAWGQIVLAKAEAIDLREKGDPQGMRPIDPQHDLVGASIDDAARAFEFHGDWSLAVEATRYELEDVKRTSIERALVRMVLTRSRQMSVQALYQLRSARQRLAVKLPAGAAFDTEPLRINGRPVLLEKGNKDEYAVPLVGRDPTTPLLLELRYTLSGAQTTFQLPEFPDEPAVQKVYLAAYLPVEWSAISTAGPWTDEMHWIWGPAGWRYGGGTGMVPIANNSEAELLNWVGQGVPDANNQSNTFQTDGRYYLFSTLRPEPGPTGALRLSTVHRSWLHGLVVLAIVGLGVLLVRRGAATRSFGAGLLIIALVLLGVFLPMLALELSNTTLAGAVVIVLVVWWGSSFVGRRPTPRPAPTTVVMTPTPPPSAPATEVEPPTADAPPAEAPPAEHDQTGGDHV